LEWGLWQERGRAYKFRWSEAEPAVCGRKLREANGIFKIMIIVGIVHMIQYEARS